MNWKENAHLSVIHLMRLLEQAEGYSDDHALCRAYHSLALSIVGREHSPETTVALRLLLDSRDAALRDCSWSER
jgi:hypothetical protein